MNMYNDYAAYTAILVVSVAVLACWFIMPLLKVTNVNTFELTPPPSINDKEQPVAILNNKRTKKYCRKVITKDHYSRIISAHDKMLTNNKDKKRDHIYAEDVAAELNKWFGFNKSRQSYAAIWNDKTPYDALPDGASLL